MLDPFTPFFFLALCKSCALTTIALLLTRIATNELHPPS